MEEMRSEYAILIINPKDVRTIYRRWRRYKYCVQMDAM
jgi:uncharacterized protein YlbG (UPF0298 family)